MIPNIWKNKLASVVSPTAAAFHTSAATLSHETRFERVSNTFFCEFGGSGGNPFAQTRFECQKLAVFLTSSAATRSHETRFECQELPVFCDFTASAATFSHETSKVFIILHVLKHPYNQYRQNVTYIRGGPETCKTSSTAQGAGGSFKDRAL